MNFPTTKVKPYVYMCVHKLTHEFYIGFRERNVKYNRYSHIDLPIYKTSSKIVHAHFENYDWVILAEFESGDDAWNFEQSLICDHWKDPLLLNANHQFNGIFRIRNKASNKGKILGPHSAERRAKNSKSQIGLVRGPHSTAHKEKIRQSNLGKYHPPNTAAQKAATVERNKKRKGTPQKTCVCPQCGKVGSISNMKRWHFNNCKDAK